MLSFLFFSNTLIFLSFFIYLLTDTVNIDQIERLLVLSVLHRLIYSSIYPQSCKLPQKGVLYRREYRTPIFVNNNTIHSKQIYRRHEEELAGVLWYTLSLTVKNPKRVLNIYFPTTNNILLSYKKLCVLVQVFVLKLANFFHTAPKILVHL